MRILHLRLSNLNSLKGEWSIDFEHPDFVSDGIFAITGPTGSGKSTLLDAICLALYGYTPRLGKVTAGQNDIMSQQTGDCFAEVIFQTAAGIYRCHWSQKRARGKADGKLQAPQHELSEVHSQAVLATKIKEVAEQVQELTGMDFEQFTRSMLLAQGSFAAFLQASADDRSPILEQITGTQIYTALSLAVHERKTQETQAYKALTDQQEALVLLNPEEEALRERELAEITAKHEALKAQSLVTQSRLEQHRKYRACQEEQQALQTQLAQWQGQWQALEPERERLRRAKATQDLKVPHVQWVQVRSDQETLQARLHQHGQTQAETAEAFAQQQSQSTAAHIALEEAKTRWKEQVPRIEEAMTLDQQIENAHKLWLERQARQQEAERETAALVQALESNQVQTLQWQAKQAELEAEVASHGEYEQLTEALPMLRQDLQQMAQYLTEIETHQTTADQAEIRLEGLQSRQQEQGQQQLAYESQERDTQLRLAEIDTRLQQVLASQSLGALADSIDEQQQITDRLKVAQRAQEAMAEIETELIRFIKEAEPYAEELLAVETKLVSHKEKQSHLAESLQSVQRELALQARIQSLESDRAHLNPGEPCPLCGAKEHPFLDGIQQELPSASEAESKYQQLLEVQASAQALHTDLTIRHTALSQKLEQNDKQQYNHRIRLHATRAGFQTACASIHESVDQAYLTALEIDERLVTQEEALRGLRTRRQEALALQEERQGLQAQWQTQQAALHRFQSDQQALLSQLEQTQQLKEQSLQALENVRQAHAEKAAQLQEHLCSYGLSYAADTDAAGEAVLSRLRGYAEQWKSWQSALTESVNQLHICTQRREDIQKAHDKSLSEARLAQERLTQQQQELSQFQQARRACFGSADPLSLKAQLEAELASVEAHQQRQSQALHTCQEALNAHQTLTEALQSQWQELVERQELYAAQFQTQLVASIFESEADFLAANLAPDAYGELEQRIDSLRTQGAKWKNRQEQVEHDLENLQPQGPFTETIGDLETQRELEESQKEALAQQLGAIQQQLRANAERKQEQQDQIQAVEQQRQEMHRWQALHDLIGSAKGKKFRNFAQGLTFDVMIYYANQHLQKMTRRYLLQREQSDSLDLSIMDSFQGGDIRSTKNLSGGESFIVSLALALGLSQMASQKVRVDSLFLDEGFGTLDEEALDVALETLSGLQQDNKLIGIISHVNTLKERMGTQIKVYPRNDGTSRISGPGCKAG